MRGIIRAQPNGLRILVIIGLIIAAAGITGLFVVEIQPKPNEDVVTKGVIRVTGTPTCLQHKESGGSQTMECAIGIKDKKGHYYALRDDSEGYSTTATMPMNEEVIIEGKLEKNTDTKYISEGTIVIAKVEHK